MYLDVTKNGIDIYNLFKSYSIFIFYFILRFLLQNTLFYLSTMYKYLENY